MGSGLSPQPLNIQFSSADANPVFLGIPVPNSKLKFDGVLKCSVEMRYVILSSPGQMAGVEAKFRACVGLGPAHKEASSLPGDEPITSLPQIMKSRHLQGTASVYAWYGDFLSRSSHV